MKVQPGPMPSSQQAMRVLVGALSLISLCGLGWGAWADWRAVVDAARLAASENATVIDHRIGEEIEEAFDSLGHGERGLVAVWDGSGPISGQAVEALDDMPHPARLAATVVVYGADGSLLHSRAPIPLNYDGSPGDFLGPVAGGSERFVLPLAKGRITGRPVLRVAQRLDGAGGKFLGVIAMGLPCDVLIDDAIDGKNLGAFGVAAVLRPDGAVLARWPVPELPPDGTPLTVPLPEADGYSWSGISPVDGIERVWGSHRSDVTGLVTVVGLATSDLRREWGMRQLRLLGAALPLFAIVAALSWRTFGTLRREKGASAALAATLAEREILLAEVHHRVKNNLQIIQSLLTMESLCAPDEARTGYQDSLQRIQAMGMIHELLYQSGEFGAIHVRDYVERLCRLLVGQADAVEWVVEGDDAVLDLDRAVPFAMAVNEIVSNTLKHAFGDGRPGRLAVEVRHRGGRLELSVSDNGIGIPAGFDPATSGNMGTRLLLGLAKQLDGEVSFEAVGGTRVRLSFPLA